MFQFLKLILILKIKLDLNASDVRIINQYTYHASCVIVYTRHQTSVEVAWQV